MVYLGKSVERDMYYGAKPELFRLAKNMRNNPTDAEKILWKKLKTFRKDGYIFRRQHPIDIFIADFYCHKLKLVIEVDGEIHSDNRVQNHDDSRSGEMEKYGIITLRLKNDYIIDNKEYIDVWIRNKIRELSSPALSWERGIRGGEAGNSADALLGAGDKRG